MQDLSKQTFHDRLSRYQAAICLETPDRIPISAGSNYFAEIYGGNNKQQFIYDANQWMAADTKFVNDFPEVDNLRSGRFWAPFLDTIGWNMYKLPGRELSPDIPFQFVESERMKADEYALFIDNPGVFILERLLPRAFDELKNPGSPRATMALVKAGIATGMQGQLIKQRYTNLQENLGMPLPMAGSITSPFDYLADGLRGLNGIMIDLFERPDEIKAACDAIVPHIVNYVLSLADPQRRWPIHMPLHRGCHPFLSPKQFDEFYWPPLKRTMELLIDAGYWIRPYLEGNWGPNWHHYRELPKGKLILDIDGPGDIFKAKADLGDWQCIAGGVPDSTLILGTPGDVKTCVRKLCEKLGKDGGYIINGGNGFPYDTKPENFRAMIDAVMEYGRYKENIDFEPRTQYEPPEKWQPPQKGMITPWKTKKQEIGDIPGDSVLIENNWETLEHAAFNWLIFWLW